MLTRQDGMVVDPQQILRGSSKQVKCTCYANRFRKSFSRTVPRTSQWPLLKPRSPKEHCLPRCSSSFSHVMTVKTNCSCTSYFIDNVRISMTISSVKDIDIWRRMSNKPSSVPLKIIWCLLQRNSSSFTTDDIKRSSYKLNTRCSHGSP